MIKKEKAERDSLSKLLGDLERETMDWLWQAPAGELTVRQAYEAIRNHRQPPLAYTTIMTVMSHLYDKGLLTRRLEGKTHYYSVAKSKEEFIARSAAQQVEMLVADFGELALAQFAGHLSAISLQELARIAQLANGEGEKED